MEGFGVRDVQIRGFRSARSVGFSPGPVCALVGGPSVGKSNVLQAIWMLLQHGDVDSDSPVHLSATLADGDEIELRTSPPGDVAHSGRPVPALFLPASQRSSALVAQPRASETAARVAAAYFPGDGHSSSAPAITFVHALERLCEAGERGVVLLIEEPELFLRPQAQRYLYRLLRSFAKLGNQVLYSTHEPSFLNVGRLEELALVDYGPDAGTSVTQPKPLPADAGFRALSELDAERGELFLASAVMLVEGRTEKLTFPLIFRALGHDHDREAITIVDCGGKPNIPLFIQICQAAHIPFLAVHDRDAPPGRSPSRSEATLNAEIARLAGPHRTVELAPDFEGAAGLRGHRHKPTRAWQRFAHAERASVPRPLADAVEAVVRLARE
jgi:predicted ATPase